ncbi:MAG: GNAT family N-acetyltransferase [Bacteroidota bacterium]
MPVVLLGRLAVHSEVQGKGIGGFLLFDALERAVSSAQNVGSVGVIVDAKDDNAESFYTKYGFVRITEEWPRRMFLSFRTFEQAS